MDFVLFGVSEESAPLLRAINGTAGHRLLAYWSPTTPIPKLDSIFVNSRYLRIPADALSLKNSFTALVDSADPEVLEVVRQLAANGVPLAIWPHAAHGIEFIYQLGLIRDEQPDQFRLISVGSLEHHLYIQRLREAIESERLGKVHQISWNRCVQNRSETTSASGLKKGLVQAYQVRDAFLRDVGVLLKIAGPFQQIAALETGDPSNGIVQSTVKLLANRGRSVNWTCMPSEQSDFWKLIVSADAGEISLSGSEDQDCLHWESTVASLPVNEEAECQTGRQQLEQLLSEAFSGASLAAIGGEHSDRNQDSAASSLTAGHGIESLLSQFDLLEGLERSLRRRRTVDIYFDVPSERSNFKSQMAAMGCLVLLLTLVAIPVGLMGGAIAKELELPDFVMQVVRVLVFLPLFLFLLLQFGYFLAKPSAKSGQQ